MYAQCPSCLTFFRLRPEHLKAAGGRVRCSRCKHVFNALETLREELTAEEIATVKSEARQPQDTRPPWRPPDEEMAGDLFDALDYRTNEELPLDEPEPAPQEAPGFDPISEIIAPPPPKRRQWLLGILNVLLLLALAVQLVHWQRETLLAHGSAGPWLRKAYTLVGIDPGIAADAALLRVARTEVSSHPESPRALLLTAILENEAARAQPWPELYVDLQDRWGESVGARYFQPAEYLRNPEQANKPMQARMRAAIRLEVIDPGNEAVGFKLDACYPHPRARSTRYLCTSDFELALR